MLDEMTQRKSQKIFFHIFGIQKPMIPGYDQSIHQRKYKVVQKVKINYIYMGFSTPKIWEMVKNISLGHFIKHIPLISEVHLQNITHIVLKPYPLLKHISSLNFIKVSYTKALPNFPYILTTYSIGLNNSSNGENELITPFHI